MLVIKFDLVLLYGAIAVFDPDLDPPLNEPSPRYRLQGFSWRPGCVDFEMRDGTFDVAIEVHKDELPESEPRPIRAMRVPYSVGDSGQVKVSNIVNDVEVPIPPGTYTLLFELGDLGPAETDSDEWRTAWCRLSFTQPAIEQAELLIVDDELAPTYPLLMDARPISVPRST